MLLAKCLRKLPNDCCIHIKNILQDENYFFTYDTTRIRHGISRNIVLINTDVIFSYFNDVYNIINTLIILFNPKLEIKMHYSNSVKNYNNYIFWENELPEYIIDEWFYDLNPSKIIMVWNASYFTY